MSDETGIKSIDRTVFSEHMANETIKLLDTCDEELKYLYLKIFINKVVLDSLNKKPGRVVSKKELYNITKRNFLGTKLDIQEAIGLGFSEAMKKFSGQYMDYYCQIKPMVEVSKALN